MEFNQEPNELPFSLGFMDLNFDQTCESAQILGILLMNNLP